MLQVAENRDVSGPVSVSAGGEANPIAQSADVPSISLSLTSQGTDTLRSSSAHFSDGDPTTVPAYGLVDAQLAHLMQSQVRMKSFVYFTSFLITTVSGLVLVHALHVTKNSVIYHGNAS